MWVAKAVLTLWPVQCAGEVMSYRLRGSIKRNMTHLMAGAISHVLLMVAMRGFYTFDLWIRSIRAGFLVSPCAMIRRKVYPTSGSVGAKDNQENHLLHSFRSTSAVARFLLADTAKTRTGVQWWTKLNHPHSCVGMLITLAFFVRYGCTVCWTSWYRGPSDRASYCSEMASQ